jgi:hypothetical protein
MEPKQILQRIISCACVKIKELSGYYFIGMCYRASRHLSLQLPHLEMCMVKTTRSTSWVNT